MEAGVCMICSQPHIRRLCPQLYDSLKDGFYTGGGGGGGHSHDEEDESLSGRPLQGKTVGFSVSAGYCVALSSVSEYMSELRKTGYTLPEFAHGGNNIYV